MSSTQAAKISSVCCQPKLSISATASGENRNCPNEPAAVPAPNASVRHSGGISLPNAPITMVNEQPASPKPISTPAVRWSIARRVGVGHRRQAERIEDGARRSAPARAPKRSAIAPANGCAAPHSSIWIASASANTSRPQPLRARHRREEKCRSPSAARSRAAPIRQPQTRMTAGVRQTSGDAGWIDDGLVAFARRSCVTSRSAGQAAAAAGRAPAFPRSAG